METDRKELEGALRALKGAVSSRPGIPALTGVLVEGDGAGLATLTATDLETTATARIAAGCSAPLDPDLGGRCSCTEPGPAEAGEVTEVDEPERFQPDQDGLMVCPKCGKRLDYEAWRHHDCEAPGWHREPEPEPTEDAVELRDRVTRAAKPGEELRRRLGRVDDSTEQWAELADVGTVAGAGRSAVRVRVVVGPDGSPMVDARRFVDSARYSGPTRKGFALRPSEAGQLAELLRDAQAAADAL